MTKIAIVYHSGYGHTAKLAQAVALGVKKSNAEAQIFTADEATKNLAALKPFDAIIFGAPTYMGGVSAPFKAFMDASSAVWMEQGWKDKIAAGFTNSGSLSGDKLNSLVQLAIFAAQHSMIWVGTGMMPSSDAAGNYGKGKLNRLGSFLGTMAQSDNAPPDVTPPQEDLDTASHLGERVAKLANKIKS